MSTIETIGTPFNAGLLGIMEAQDIAPGSDAGYETCKSLWQYHPLGGKIVEKPITLAQTDGQKITVSGVAEETFTSRPPGANAFWPTSPRCCVGSPTSVCWSFSSRRKRLVPTTLMTYVQRKAT